MKMSRDFLTTLRHFGFRFRRRNKETDLEAVNSRRSWFFTPSYLHFNAHSQMRLTAHLWIRIHAQQSIFTYHSCSGVVVAYHRCSLANATHRTNFNKNMSRENTVAQRSHFMNMINAQFFDKPQSPNELVYSVNFLIVLSGFKFNGSHSNCS